MAADDTLGYGSSEELQRHNHEVFLSDASKKKNEADTTEKDKLKKVLDQYIQKHSKTSTVRDMAQKNNRTADYQLDLSADIIEILEKIKSDLR